METVTVTKKQLVLWILYALAGILILLVAFHAGRATGYRKAGHDARWSENYHRNFAGPQHGFMSGFADRDFVGAHGIFGRVISVDATGAVIEGREGKEQVVIVNENTEIRRFQDKVALSDLKADEYVVVIGEPADDGRVAAKFIRVVPPPPVSRGTR